MKFGAQRFRPCSYIPFMKSSPSIPNGIQTIHLIWETALRHLPASSAFAVENRRSKRLIRCAHESSPCLWPVQIFLFAVRGWLTKCDTEARKPLDFIAECDHVRVRCVWVEMAGNQRARMPATNHINDLEQINVGNLQDPTMHTEPSW